MLIKDCLTSVNIRQEYKITSIISQRKDTNYEVTFVFKASVNDVGRYVLNTTWQKIVSLMVTPMTTASRLQSYEVMNDVTLIAYSIFHMYS